MRPIECWGDGFGECGKATFVEAVCGQLWVGGFESGHGKQHACEQRAVFDASGGDLQVGGAAAQGSADHVEFGRIAGVALDGSGGRVTA